MNEKKKYKHEKKEEWFEGNEKKINDEDDFNVYNVDVKSLLLHFLILFIIPYNIISSRVVEAM